MKQILTDEKCPRCGSPRKVIKIWKETIITSGGEKSVLEYTQTGCTNKECQAEFDEQRALEVKRQEDLKNQREERDAARKSNAFSQAQTARKSKLKV